MLSHKRVLDRYNYHHFDIMVTMMPNYLGNESYFF